MKSHRMFTLTFLLALLAVGAHSVSADEKLSPIHTALSSTTISGYVNTSAQWQTQQRSWLAMPQWLRSYFVWVWFLSWMR